MLTQQKNYKISLFLTSTTDRKDDLLRFINGLEQQTTQNPIKLYFVNQAPIIPKYNWENANFKSEIIISNKLSLSAARNLALTHISPLNESCEIIGFPDDDCWYSNDLLENILKYFQVNPECNCLCTNVFDPNNQKSYGNRPLNQEKKVTFNNIFKLPISVGIFIKRDSLNQNQIFFDETLGAGTKLGSGEETDLISRLLEVGCKINYNGYLKVYHPVVEYINTDVKKYYKYSVGFGFLIAKLIMKKHKIVFLFFMETFIRSLSGMFFYVFSPLKRKLYLGRMKGMINGLFYGYKS